MGVGCEVEDDVMVGEFLFDSFEVEEVGLDEVKFLLLQVMLDEGFVS